MESIHRKGLSSYIGHNFGSDKQNTQIFPRQGFVLPPPSSTSEAMNPTLPTQRGIESDGDAASTTTAHAKDDLFHSNPTDAGRPTHHSSNPNMGPDGALGDILPGEELTMDSSFHGYPEWCQRICAKWV